MSRRWKRPLREVVSYVLIVSLCVALLPTFMCVEAAASGKTVQLENSDGFGAEVALSTDKTEVAQGEKFTITVSLTSCTEKIYAADLYIDRDQIAAPKPIIFYTKYLEDMEIQSYNDFPEHDAGTDRHEINNFMIWASCGSNNKTGFQNVGDIFSVTFTVAETAPTGMFPIDLDYEWGAVVTLFLEDGSDKYYRLTTETGGLDITIVEPERPEKPERPIQATFDYEDGYYWTGEPIPVINPRIDDTKYEIVIKKEGEVIDEDSYAGNGISVDAQTGISVTDRGNYQATFELRDGYTWSDDTTDPVSFEFSVEGRKITIDTNLEDAGDVLQKAVNETTNNLEIQLEGTGQKTLSLIKPLKIPANRIITIQGMDEDNRITLQAQAVDPTNKCVIDIPASSTLNLSNVTVDAQEKGRVIYNMGTVNLTNTGIQNGYLDETSKPANTQWVLGGAGLYNGSTATANLEKCLISENTISCKRNTSSTATIQVYGAGIYNAAASMAEEGCGIVTMKDTDVSENTISGREEAYKSEIYGVGIYNQGEFAVSGGSIEKNVMKVLYGRNDFSFDTIYGLAISAKNGTNRSFTIENCSITGNEIIDEFGGIDPAVQSYGTVYKASAGKMSLKDVSISENIQELPKNTKPMYGTVFVENAKLEMTDTEITENTVIAAEDSKTVIGGLCAGGLSVINIGGKTVVKDNTANGSPSDFVFEKVNVTGESYISISSALKDGSAIHLGLGPGIREKYEREDGDTAVVKPGDGYQLTETDFGCFAVQESMAQNFELRKNTEEETSAIASFDLHWMPFAVESITLLESSISLTKGETHTLTAAILPEDAGNRTVTWTTDNPQVATVADSVVTAKEVGTAVITAEVGGKSATCTVTVIAESPTGTTTPTKPLVEVSSVELSEESLDLETGETYTLIATVLPENAANRTVTWTTDNPQVATVADGVVTAKEAGTAVITAEAGGRSATCTVTVTAAREPLVEVSSIELSEKSLDLEEGDFVTLTATVLPENAANRTVTWSTSNAGAATVDGDKDEAVVTAKGVGTAVITAEAGGKSATCTVTVTAESTTDVTSSPPPSSITPPPSSITPPPSSITPPPSSITPPPSSTSSATSVTGVSLSKKAVTVPVKKTVTLSAAVAPATAANKNVTWKSSDTKVATVTNKGKVTAKKAGTATITVTTADGGKKATCKVTVAEVKLNASSMSLQVNKSTSALKVSSKYPANDKVKSWKSSNTKVAAVTSKGKITAKKVGTAKITVTMKSGATATCTVKVQKAKVVTKKLAISSKKLTVKKGKKATLTVTRTPISATEKITWKSSNTKVATVTSKGVVKAKKAGKATITAKTSNGKKVTCKVTVKK